MGEDNEFINPVPSDQAEDVDQGEVLVGTSTEEEATAEFLLRRDIRYCCSFPAYLFTTRVRFGYTFFLLAAFVFVFMIAFVFEIFFSVLLPSSREAEGWGLRAAFMLPFAPFVLIIGAVLLDEVMDMMFDAAGPGFLLNFRLRLAAVIHTCRNFRKDPREVDVQRSTWIIVEVITPVLLELLPFLNFIVAGLATKNFVLAVGGYFQMGMLWAIVMLVIFCLCDLLTHYAETFRTTFLWILERNAQPSLHNAWSTPIGYQQRLLFPWWQLWPTKWFTNFRETELRKDAAATDTWDEEDEAKACCCFKYSRMYRKKVPIGVRVIADLALFIVVAILIVCQKLNFAVGWMILCLIMLLLALKLQERFPRVLGITFMAAQAFFTIFAAFLFVFAASGVALSSGYSALPPSPKDAGIIVNGSSSVTSEKYSVCSNVWGGLDVVDLGIMSNLAYAISTDNFEELMHKAFNNTAMSNWTLKYRSPDKDPISFTEVYFPATNLTVLSVRGTSTAVEVYEDANMYSPISFFQFVNKFVPILSVIPEITIQKIINAVALDAFSSPPVYEKVINHAEKIVADRDVIVTGHSLGGAIANIVAGKVGISSVSFSPPGLRYELLKVEIEMEALRRHVISIIPESDVVPKVDVQVGAIHQIGCEASVVGCHSMDNTLCTLLDVCGNTRRRQISEYCESTREALQ